MIKELRISNYRLWQAIMIYESDQSFYLESHRVDEKGKLLEGHPLKKDTIWRVFEALAAKSKPVVKGLLPSNLLAFNSSTGNLMWWNPAQKRKLFFTKDLSIPDGAAYCPPLLFWTEGQRLSVHALKTNRRPVDNTPTYQAPFHNTDASGSVCLGGAGRPKANLSVEARTRKWEYAFFNSKFSHLTGGSPVKKPHNINSTWKKLIKTGDKFPKDVLIKRKVTVGGIGAKL